MSSNLKVNTILPSTGTSIGIGTAGGSITSNSPLSIASGGINVTGVSTFVTNTDGTTDLLTLHADADGTNNGVASIKLMGNAGNHAAFIKGGHTTNGDSILTFHTDAHASGINPEERLRIDSSGRLLLGTTTEGAADADDLTISTSGNTGITIRSGTTHNGSIYFSDTTSGIGEYAGQIDYDHNNNSLNFYADNDQCLRLLNDKSVSISDKLVLENGTVFLNKHSVGVGTTTQGEEMQVYLQQRER